MRVVGTANVVVRVVGGGESEDQGRIQGGHWDTVPLHKNGLPIDVILLCPPPPNFGRGGTPAGRAKLHRLHILHPLTSLV